MKYIFTLTIALISIFVFDITAFANEAINETVASNSTQVCFTENTCLTGLSGSIVTFFSIAITAATILYKFLGNVKYIGKTLEYVKDIEVKKTAKAIKIIK